MERGVAIGGGLVIAALVLWFIVATRPDCPNGSEPLLTRLNGWVCVTTLPSE